MPVTSDVYFADFFNGNGALNGRTPDVGGIWSGSGATSGGHTVAGSQGQSSQAAANPKYIEKVLRFEKTDDVDTFIQFKSLTLPGLSATWTLRATPSQDTIELGLFSTFVHADIGNAGPGIHEIRIIGEGAQVTAYFDGLGLRMTDVPDDGSQDYDVIGFVSDIEVEVLEIWGKDGIEPDYELTFDTDFGPVGGPSGGSGGGGGSGGSPSGGGSNPSDIPCDPNTTLVINNGEVVAVAPTNPCQWTGLIWWKLVCEATLTANDYAVEAEVFFNTLTDPFMSVGVIARLNESTGGHYWATLWNDEIAIGKKPSAGADDIMLGFKLLTLQAGRWYKIRLEVEGFTLRAYLDDVLQVTAVDLNESFPDAGCAGIRLSRSNPATDIRFDNFRVWLNVLRPSFAELPVFLESISILKDDGMTSDFSIGLADSFNASEALTLLTPKTVHINEGIVFDDLPKQVKKIQEFVQALDTMDEVRARIALSEALAGNEALNLRMGIPISEVFTFTDQDRAIHGITETTTIGEFLIALFKESGALDLARASDTVKITRTSTADFVAPEQTYEARPLKTMFSVGDGKRVN